MNRSAARLSLPIAAQLFFLIILTDQCRIIHRDEPTVEATPIARLGLEWIALAVIRLMVPVGQPSEASSACVTGIARRATKTHPFLEHQMTGQSVACWCDLALLNMSASDRLHRAPRACRANLKASAPIATTKRVVAGYSYGSYYGYSSPYYSSYYAPPVRSYARTTNYRYPPPGDSYYREPFAFVTSYDEYLIRSPRR